MNKVENKNFLKNVDLSELTLNEGRVLLTIQSQPGITLKELCSAFPYMKERAVRKILESIRHKKIPVCNTGNGYRIPSTVQELMEGIEYIKRQISGQLETLDCMNEVLENNMNKKHYVESTMILENGGKLKFYTPYDTEGYSYVEVDGKKSVVINTVCEDGDFYRPIFWLLDGFDTKNYKIPAGGALKVNVKDIHVKNVLKMEV